MYITLIEGIANFMSGTNNVTSDSFSLSQGILLVFDKICLTTLEKSVIL